MEDDKKTPALDELPIHALRSALKDRDIKFSNKDKKADLIKMLEAGETLHKPKPKEKAPILQDQATKKSIPVVPKEIRDDLDRLGQQGLRWEINEEEGTINFFRDIPTCANLDQPSNNILSTAKEAFGKTKPRILSDYG